jgi:hypothetical protein
MTLIISYPYIYRHTHAMHHLERQKQTKSKNQLTDDQLELYQLNLYEEIKYTLKNYSNLNPIYKTN